MLEFLRQITREVSDTTLLQDVQIIKSKLETTITFHLKHYVQGFVIARGAADRSSNKSVRTLSATAL